MIRLKNRGFCSRALPGITFGNLFSLLPCHKAAIPHLRSQGLNIDAKDFADPLQESVGTCGSAAFNVAVMSSTDAK